MNTGHGRSRPAPDRSRDYSQPLPSSLSWAVLGVFALAFTIAFLVLQLPWWLPALYAALSIGAFAAYGMDKAAARGGRRRVSEQMLLALGLLGGWPGAVFAQQLFRHKTRKRAFRRVFWGTVVINVTALAAFIAFATLSGITLGVPLGTLTLRTL